ncbi:S-adenosyl-L-methionine-dependent methyltransferase [Hypoxylon crocopeplum]|nr:S-adenosyl-L-methionine-dependent methyltransferase [Hypoxylon crocopeplum]
MDSSTGSSEDGASPPQQRRGWEDEELSADNAQAVIERAFQDMPERTGHVMVDLTQNNEAEEAERQNEIAMQLDIARVIEVVDLTLRKAPQKPRNIVRPPKRNPPVVQPNICMDSYTHDDVELKPGVTVEIEPISHLYQASFLWIQFIIRIEAGIILRGLPLTRIKNLRGQLPRLRNEVSFVLEVDDDDFRPDQEQAAIEIPVGNVKAPRVCHVTNKSFPAHRFPTGVYKTIDDIEERGVLICRWKCRRVWADAVKRINDKPPIEFSISRITAEEVTRARFHVPNSCLINTWRGGIIRGGSFVPEEPESSKLMVNLDGSARQHDTSQDTWIPRKPGQQFTLADMFCGAGGVSCGARAAGFRVKLSCDNAKGACNTYRVEYPEVELWEEDMYDFIMSMRGSSLRIDVLHLSPPCQFWSPAHTVPGVDDEANIAILFSCHELVKSLRPRIFTLEQTFGILHPRFEFYFNALIHGFTQHDYSVRWKVANLLQWGAPSQRQRLLMIGACPGEELPPFPVATHSGDHGHRDGTKRYRTVKHMLRKIPQGTFDELHQPRSLKRLHLPSWNPKTPLARTITCSGGVGNYHYSGKRGFTLREFAMLQGFPVNYSFQKPHQKKQIGNAFPPLVVRTLYKHLRRWLEQQDKVLASDDELSESESESDEDSSGSDSGDGFDDDDSDVECLGERRIEQDASDVEVLGGRTLHQQASVMRIDDSSSDDAMDVDAISGNEGSTIICADAVQLRGTRPHEPIELD